jgi:hypothetical protein
MKNKTELEIKKNDIRNICLIILTPLILTFIVEHFGEFNLKSFGGQISTLTLVNSSFETPFGNTVEIKDGVKAYKTRSDGRLTTFFYIDKIPYYLKGVGKDIIYPIILIIVLLIGYLFKHKYSIKIT